MRIKMIFVSLFVVGALFAAFLVLTGINEVSAATYYVSTTGSDSNSGSESKPFRTIDKAASIVNPGDTVIVKNGTYTDTNGDGFAVRINRGGTSSNWIKFKAENKWGAIIDGKSYATGYCWVIGKNANYVRVEDFEVRDCYRGGFWSNDGANHVYLFGNKIHGIGHRTDCNMDCCSGACTCGNAGGYQGKTTTYHTYDSNIFYDIGRLPQGGCSSIYYNHDHGLYVQGTYSTVINNIFYNIEAGWPIIMANGSDHWDIINNTFYGANPGRVGHINFDEGNSDVDIINNISYSPNSVFLENGKPSSSDSGNIKNNLVYDASLADSGVCNHLTCSDNIVDKDPKFVDAGDYDFHIRSDSPAINKGLAYSGRTYDADGKPIVGAPDIGAYETGSSDTVPPAPPAVIEIK